MTDSNRRVFIIVPAYNEAKVLESVLIPLVEAGYSVVVVDDGSDDDTPERLSHLPVFALRHAINLGQGAALQTGMTFALREGADYLVHFDADGQHRLRDIEAMLGPLRAGAAEAVLGSRFLRAEDRQQIPGLRRLVLRVASVVSFLLTGTWVDDPHNGLRAFTANAAKRLRIRENGYAHASEILRLLRKQHIPFVQRPIAVLYTEYSLSKGQPLSNALNILVDLLVGRLFK